MGVGEWFAVFCKTLRINVVKRQSVAKRTGRVVGQLNADLRGLDSTGAYRFYVGSYGRNTAIPSVSDVDLLYELPPALYYKYRAYQTNGQSALLSAVRTSLRKTYPTSEIAGDGQVVVIHFNDGIKFEILPAFKNPDDSYTFADSNNGGSWKTCKPKQEMAACSALDSSCNGNLVELSRMVRAWRDRNEVPISGMLIDTLAYQFIENWAFRDMSYLYYDLMTRDFFAFLARQNPQQQYWHAPGSGSYVHRKGTFEHRARQAELRAMEAIAHLNSGKEWAAKQKFREIYGTSFQA